MENASKPPVQPWLLSRDGKTYGPMSSSQLKQLCESGKIRPADLICRVGSERWTPAGEVRGLFPQASSSANDVQEAPVRPVEEASGPSSRGADAYWKTVGSVFCLANLVACGGYGLVKSPPGLVQTMEDVKATTRKMKADLEGVTKGLGATFVDPTKTMDELKKEVGKASNRNP